jgi:outer membrane lipoprotein SlyB
MAIVLGSFELQTQSDDAIDRLKRAGFDDADFSVVSNAENAVGAPEDDDQRANTQVDLALVGGAAGAVLGGFLLGPIGAVIGGAAAGGLAAALRPHGATEAEVAAYEHRLHAGRYILAVRTETAEQSDEARRILNASGAEEVHVDR